MSIFRHAIGVGDPQGQRFETLEALVDTGSTLTTAPAEVLERLGVQRERQVRLRLADDRVIERGVGETYVRLNGQTLRTLVLFSDAGEPTLLGVYTLEAALLAVDPLGQKLIATDALMMTLI